jgi:hypothetical protein
MRLTPGGVGGSGKVEKGEADYGQTSVEAAVASRYHPQRFLVEKLKFLIK